MNDNVMLSVIMPLYNMEKYIRQAIDSVISQSYKDFELILIDDGSTDLSADICDEYSYKDARIKVIHKENEGLALARNEGLLIARGKYIYFMDADDKINKELFKDNIRILEKYKCSMVVFSHVTMLTDNNDKICSIRKNNLGIEGLYTFSELKNNFDKHIMNVSHSVWNRIYKKSVIKNILFEKEAGKSEDAVFNIRVLDKGITSIYYNNKVYYMYINHKTSLMSNFSEDRFINDIKVIDMYSSLMKKWGIRETNKKSICYKYIEAFMFLYENFCGYNCPYNVKEISEKVKEYRKNSDIKEAFKIIKMRDIKRFGNKVIFFLSKIKMYKTCYYFKKFYVPLSKRIHSVILFFKRKMKQGEK